MNANTSAMPTSLVVLLLALLLGLQPITTDFYLPALPALSEGFGASMAQTQLTLTALPLVLGVWFWSACIALSAWVLVGKYTETPETIAVQAHPVSTSSINQ